MLCDADVEATTNSSTLPGTCSDWEGNNSTLGFGSDLASEAAAINASESEQAPITAFASGGVLPSLMFDVIDHFGNLVSGTCSTPPSQFHQSINWQLCIRYMLHTFTSIPSINQSAALSQVHAPHRRLNSSINQLATLSQTLFTWSRSSSRFHQSGTLQIFFTAQQ